MRYTGFLLLLCLFACSRKSDYINNIEQIQKQKLADMINPERSPLDAEELKTFEGIYHFKADEKWNIKAQVTWLPFMGLFDMPHSGGSVRPYFKAATLQFVLDGKTYMLTAYQNEQMRNSRDLFLPFADLTNGKETYGGGRYIDIKYAPNTTEVLIDFNLCYFPYCAYSHRYSCPIVPKENSLDTEITAGERFRSAGH